MKIIYGIDIGRVSSTKQGLAGDSLDDQEKQIQLSIQRVENIHQCKIVIKKHFDFTESASGDLDLQPLMKAIEYCKNPENNIKFAFIKSIDRATRAGSVVYGFLKGMFAEAGVTLMDCYGIISTQTVNTLGHLGVQYKWSVYSPSWVTELLEAERAKGEVRDILTRMLGAEIRYVRLGYTVRLAPMGYTNKKIETEHGIRNIPVPHPVESPWFTRMFELRIQGNVSDEEIVQQVNAMGFKTRKLRIHDKLDKTKIIGYKGERLLTIKDLQRFIKNPIYAGINKEKWTNGEPIKGRFNGLVTIDMFNKANKGKITIVEDGNTLKIYKGKVDSWRLKKDKDNPLYPYKEQVRCPFCRRPLLGSAPRNGSGKPSPTYHCGGIRRGHKYFGVPVKKLHETIENFVRNVQFTEEYYLKFKQVVLEEWQKREDHAESDTIAYNQRVAQIGKEIQNLKEKIKILSSPTAIKLIEDDIDKLANEKLQAIVNRDKKEEEEVDIHVVMGYIKYFMERFEDLLLGSDNPLQNAALFGLIFDEPPTYQELLDGTVKLAPLFKLNEAYKQGKSMTVGPRGVEPLTFAMNVRCSPQ